MTGAVAFDSKEFRRGRIRQFFTPLGVSVEVPDAERFKTHYEEVMVSFRKKHCIRDERICCPSISLLRHFGKERSINPMEDIVNALESDIERVAFYFVILGKGMDSIKIYGRGMAREVSRDDFLVQINPAFVHSCLWKFVSTHPSNESTYYVDHFHCDVTGGWTEIEANPRIQVYFRGDECNPFVSFADLLAGTTDLLFQKNCWRFDSVDAEKLFEECSFKTEFVGMSTPDLHYITPLENKPIDLTSKVKHPIVFFVNEKRPQSLSEITSKDFVRKFLSRNPSWHEALNLAYKSGGCAKLFEQTEDLSLISDHDIMIYTGNLGKEVARYFQGYCPNMRIMKASELFQDKQK